MMSVTNMFVRTQIVMFCSKWLLKRSPVQVGATISELNTPIQTPKDMVFSQMSQKTQSVLKVVNLARLKPEKNQQVNGSTGVVIDGYLDATSSSPTRPTFSEEFLKLEPTCDDTMFHDTDSVFFQDLVQWCSTPAKDDQASAFESKKAEERAFNNDNTYTTFSPRGWDGFDTNSPYTQAGFYNTTPNNPLSPNLEGLTPIDNKFFGLQETEKQIQFQEQFLDISRLPVVIGDLMSERANETSSWPATEQVEWTTAHDTYTKPYTDTHTTLPFIDQEDSLDLKYVSVIPREVENNNVVISEYEIKDSDINEGILKESGEQKRIGGLSVDVATRAPGWPSDIISTPEVLSYVEQLEKEKCPQIMKTKQLWSAQHTPVASTETSPKMSPSNYEPITPKSESHVESDHDDIKTPKSKRRRHNSEDSDETYTPYTEDTPRKYKRKKPNVPIKDMILALEGSQQLTKARRGRPPKRRESTVSSVCSIDDNSSSISTQELKYRELRDKNNEASKRSRLNRKLKELQMEQLADELEEKNKKLQVKADILEDMTKRLKEALMTAILQK